ncbi:MAG: DUF7439 family protein [Mycobacteriaceae bacterium]
MSLSGIVSLLPLSLQDKAKTVVALLGVVLGVLALVFANATWLPVVIQVATALGIYATPNLKPVTEPAGGNA